VSILLWCHNIILLLFFSDRHNKSSTLHGRNESFSVAEKSSNHTFSVSFKTKYVYAKYRFGIYCFQVTFFLAAVLTMHEAKHELQITATVFDHVIHITRSLAIPPQVVFRAHSGGTFIGKKTPSLLWVQPPGPFCVVYPITPHVNNANTSTCHDHIRSKRSASGFADHYLK